MFRGLKALITGVITGIGFGVLFAPDKGSKTRDKIKSEGFDGVKDTMKEMGQDISETSKTVYEEVSENEKVQTAMSGAKSKAEELYKEHVPSDKRKQIKRAVKDAKKEIKKGVKKAKKTVKEVKKKINKKK